MKRLIQSRGGKAVEFPRIDYLYDDYNGDKNKLYGKGFTYSGRLHDTSPPLLEKEVIEKIDSHFFDLIVFGKVGPDEMQEGTLPHLPLWNHVMKAKYRTKEIVFLYGGDECIDLTTENRYKHHILEHAPYGYCFVRELRR
jgi:hypothetical protein